MEKFHDIPAVDLPPPNWSPTGNSGSWVWDENYALRVGNKKEVRGCYKWCDDVYGYEWREGLRGATMGRVGGLPWARKKSWFEKLKNFLTT